MKKKIIVIGGDNGGGSAGDEIMCEAACAYFRALSDEVKIVTDAQYKGWSSPVKNIQVFQQVRKDLAGRKIFSIFTPLKKIIRLLALPYLVDKEGCNWLIGHGEEFKYHLRDANVLFFAGCGGLNDKYPVNAIAWLSMINAAKKLDVNVFVSGVGIGPIQNLFVRNVVKKIVNSVDFISVRDAGRSYQFLEDNKDIGEYDWVPDDAFFYSTCKVKGYKKKPLRVGLNLMPSLFNNAEEVENLARLVNENLSLNHALYLLPVTHEDYEVLAHVKRFNPTATLVDRVTPSKMKELVGSMDVIFSARYHGCVFGVSQKVPTCGIFLEDYWKFKIQGLFDMALVEAPVFHLSSFVTCLEKGGLPHLINSMQDMVISERQYEELSEKRFLAHGRAAKILNLSRGSDEHFVD